MYGTWEWGLWARWTTANGTAATGISKRRDFVRWHLFLRHSHRHERSKRLREGGR